jgi:DNA-binding PadR family transcriptional regulator
MTNENTHRRGGTNEQADAIGEHHSHREHGHHEHGHARGHHGQGRHHHGHYAHGQGHGHEGGHGHGPHGGHGRGRGGPGGRGEGRRKRLFSAAELSLVLLHLMESQARHGYELIRELDSRTGGAYAPSPGIVYPTLTALEEAGLIAAVASDGAKRLFGITDTGKAFLAEQQEAVTVALAKLASILATVSQVDTGPVARAMQNLAMVLEHRLASPQEKQALFDIADLIDDTARKIERMG